MENKIIEVWINVYPDRLGSAVHPTKEMADKAEGTGRIVAVKLTGEYQIKGKE